VSLGRNTATFCYAPGSGFPMSIWCFSRRSVMQSITFYTTTRCVGDGVGESD
jgi:hypothetical protein